MAGIGEGQESQVSELPPDTGEGEDCGAVVRGDPVELATEAWQLQRKALQTYSLTLRGQSEATSVSRLINLVC